MSLRIFVRVNLYGKVRGLSYIYRCVFCVIIGLGRLDNLYSQSLSTIVVEFYYIYRCAIFLLFVKGMGNGIPLQTITFPLINLYRFTILCG